MKRIMTLIIMLLCLLLVACGPAVEPCPPHVDEDKNCICDNCQTEFVPDDVTAAINSVDLSELTFLSKSVRYNGREYTIEVGGTLPEGVSVKYENNSHTNAGTYSAVAKFYLHSSLYNKDYYLEGKDMTAELKIRRALYDVSGVYFGGASAVYDGKAHSLEVEGSLPEGVSISYENNGKSEVGDYIVKANFVVDSTNYETPAPLEARLSIVPGPASLGGVTLRDKVVAFNGEAHSLSLEAGNIDLSSVTVSSTGNEIPYIGENIVRFVLTVGGESATLEAKLTIEAEELVGTEGLEYELKAGKLWVVGYTGSSRVVVIPNKHIYNNIEYNVTKIASGAFLGNTNIEYVVMSDSLGSIGNNAFQGCESLKRVTLGGFVSSIGGLAFDGCAIDEIALPDSLLAIGKSALRGNPLAKITLPFIGGSANTSSGYLGYLFGADGYAGNGAYVPSTLETVVISDFCEEIPAYAMRGCSGVKNIIIGERVKKIGISAFEGTAISEIYIPASVTSIPAAANNYNSPFYNTSSELVIKLEALGAPSEYGAVWCVIDSEGTKATVEYGKKR